MEIVLDRKLVDRRIFPAIDVNKTGTRKEELLLSPSDLAKVWMLRRLWNTMSPDEAMNLLNERLRKTKSNKEFLNTIREV